MARLVSDLISIVQARASLPANQDRFSSNDIVTLLKQELEDTVMPFMSSLVEEFFVFLKTEELQDSQGIARFPNNLIPIPRRAYARGIRDIKFQTGPIPAPPADPAFRPGYDHNVPFLFEEDRAIFDFQNIANYLTPAGFFFSNDGIQLVGMQSATTDTPSPNPGRIKIWFYCRVPSLTNTDLLQAPISNIAWNTVTSQADITCDTSMVPAGQGFSLGSSGIYDLFRTSTGAYEELDLVCTSVNMGMSTTVLSTSSLTKNETTNLIQNQAGGYPVVAPYTAELTVVPSDINPYSPIPEELDNLLVLSTTGRLLEALGDSDGLQINMALLTKVQNNLVSAFGKRDVGGAHKAVSRTGIYNFMRRRWIKGRV